jgi:hypothetical protein
MTSTKQRSAARSPSALSDAWDRRTSLVKQEQAAASAASDAKTARLKALRLEKERTEAEAASDVAQTPAPVRKRVKRIVV